MLRGPKNHAQLFQWSNDATELRIGEIPPLVTAKWSHSSLQHSAVWHSHSFQLSEAHVLLTHPNGRLFPFSGIKARLRSPPALLPAWDSGGPKQDFSLQAETDGSAHLSALPAEPL